MNYLFRVSAVALDLMLAPGDCDPPHRVGRPEQVMELQAAFARDGWSPKHPSLVGYPLNGRIQLLSGSHRWAASVGVLDRIPVAVVPLRLVEESWGDLDRWPVVMGAGVRA